MDPKLACKVDADCVRPDLTKVIDSPDDCECKACGAAPVNRATDDGREASWRTHCTMVDQYVLNNRKACPYTDCLYFDIGCREGRCQELPSRFGRPVTPLYTPVK